MTIRKSAEAGLTTAIGAGPMSTCEGRARPRPGTGRNYPLAAGGLLGVTCLISASVGAVDYDGDGLADLAFRREQPPTTLILPSSGASCPPRTHRADTSCSEGDEQERSKGRPSASACFPGNKHWHQFLCERRWGRSTDIPLEGDFDGDGLGDLALWCRQKSTYWLLPSGGKCPWGSNPDGKGCRLKLGEAGVLPVPADYDGDGIVDLAVWDRDSGIWQFATGRSEIWGDPSDTPLPGDYDEDGTADVAVIHKRFYDPIEIKLLDGGRRRLSGPDGIEDPAIGPCLVRLSKYGATIAPIWRQGKGDRWDHPVLHPTWIPVTHEPLLQAIRPRHSPSGVPVAVPADYDGDGRLDLGVLTKLSTIPFQHRLLVVLPSSGWCPDNLDSTIVDGIAVCVRVLTGLFNDDRPIKSAAEWSVVIPDAARAWCTRDGE